MLLHTLARTCTHTHSLSWASGCAKRLILYQLENGLVVQFSCFITFITSFFTQEKDIFLPFGEGSEALGLPLYTGKQTGEKKNKVSITFYQNHLFLKCQQPYEK
jgi:hypothetical protein